MNLNAIIESSEGRHKPGRPRATAGTAQHILRTAAVLCLESKVATAGEIAEAFGVSARTIRRWACGLYADAS